MDQVAGELSVVPAMCWCQKHRRHFLAHTNTPPTSNPQIQKHGNQSEGAPHLQPPLTLMCFHHLKLLIHCMHAHTHLEAHAQIYEQTQVKTGMHENRHTDTYGVQPPPCLFWRSSNMPPNHSTGYFLAQKIHQYTAFMQLDEGTHVHTDTHIHTHSSTPSANQLIHR